MRLITKDDFEIRATKSGYSVYWKARDRFVKYFGGSSGRGRAKRFIRFLVEWYGKEGWKIDSEGRVYRR